MSDVVLACGMQRAYLHDTGTRYEGDRTETVKVRLLEYFKDLNKEQNTVLFTREVHQGNDSFFREVKSYGLVGSPDIEIPEMFKPFTKFVVNTTRYNAFYRTPLESELMKIKPKRVTLVGFQLATSILFTAEELRNREYEVSVIEPLTLSEDEHLHICAVNFLSDVLSVTVE